MATRNSSKRKALTKRTKATTSANRTRKAVSKEIWQKQAVLLKLKKNDVKVLSEGRYYSVKFPDSFVVGEPGHPSLPVRKYYVALDGKAQKARVEIKSIKKTGLLSRALLEPVQPDEPTLIGNRIEFTDINEKAYSITSSIPKKPVELTGIKNHGTFCMAELTICPFVYYPKTEKLEFIEQLDINISFVAATVKPPKPESLMEIKHIQRYAERVKKFVVNPDTVRYTPEIEDIGDLIPVQLFPTVEYIIITSQALAETFERLALWRTRLGLRSRVVTVEDITAGTVPNTGGATFWKTSGYTDGGTRDLAEAVRNFIKWANVYWQTDYVLIGGDTEIVPARYAFHTAVGTVSYKDISVMHTYWKLASQPLSSTDKAGSSPGFVLDEDSATSWECDAADSSPWLQVRVGTNKPINGLEVTWGANHATGYVVEVSDDATNWTSVYTTTTGSGGTESIPITCQHTTYVRIRITSGVNFAISELQVYGPWRPKYTASAFAMNSMVTRLHMGTYFIANPTNSPDGHCIIIKEGPHAGTIIPYDTAASNTSLGWRFVEELVGTSPAVVTNPTQYVEIRGPSQYHGDNFAIKTEMNYIPTDLYYSDIADSEYPASNSHDWDEDNNLIYGERYSGELDGVNGIADIYAGRAPIETVEEAENFIEKIIRYECFNDADGFLYPTNFAVSLLLGSQDWAHNNTVGVLDGSAKGKEDIRSTYLTFDSSRWLITRRYQDYADVPTANQGPDLDEASKDEIVDAIKNGNHVVSLSSHGSSGYLCYLVTNDIDDIKSIPSLFYGNACSTNKFDVSSGEALSEWTLLNTQGAAVAYVGNSRFGWTSDNPIEHKFWEQMLYKDRLGGMYNECKLVKQGWQSYSLNLLGDPGMRVWSDRPAQLCVSHDPQIETGQQTFTVTVKSHGQPITDALVCVTMEGTLFKTGSTNASGIASLNIAPSVAGLMYITVSGKNYLPYLATVTVVKGTAVCNPLIACTVALSCKQLIACGLKINCGIKIACTKMISCGASIVCGKAIACGPAIACSKAIACGIKIACGKIGDICPTILPKDFYRFREQIHDVWGSYDVEELLKHGDLREVQDMVDSMPPDLRKSFRFMMDRMKEDARNG